jgi:methyl-accepting chemotaxis protein
MALTALAAAMWQTQETIGSGDGHWLMIFAGIAAFALLGQSLVLVGGALVALKLQKDLSGEIAQLKAKLMGLVDTRVVPLMDKSDALITDLTPQLKEITAKVATLSANVEQISELVHEKLVEFGPTISAVNHTLHDANETARAANETAKEVNLKARQQVVRVNGMVTGVLDATTQVGKSIQHSINVPVREVAGIVDGVKVAVKTFLRGKPAPKLATYRPPVGIYEPAKADPFAADVYAKDKPDLEP